MQLVPPEREIAELKERLKLPQTVPNK